MPTNKLKHIEKIKTPLFDYLIIIFLISILIIGMIWRIVMAYIAIIIIISFTLIVLYYLIYKKLFTVKKEIKREHYTVLYSYDKRKNKIYDQDGLDINIKKEYYDKFARKIINILKKYAKKDECGVEYIEYLDK